MSSAPQFGPNFDPTTPRPAHLPMIDPANAGMLGPSPSVLEGYRELTGALEQGTNPGFSPRVIAEQIGGRIDEGALRTYYDPTKTGPAMEYGAHWKMAQQAFVASALGLRVGALEINPNSWITEAKRGLGLTVPPVDSLPVLRGGVLLDPVTGKQVTQGQADTAWSQYFFAKNRAEFTEPIQQQTSGRWENVVKPTGPFERLFVRIIHQIETRGQLAVAERPNIDRRGPISAMRTIARSVGYTSIGPFTQDNKGIWRANVDPTARRAGFDHPIGGYTPERRTEILDYGKK